MQSNSLTSLTHSTNQQSIPVIQNLSSKGCLANFIIVKIVDHPNDKNHSKLIEKLFGVFAVSILSIAGTSALSPTEPHIANGNFFLAKVLTYSSIVSLGSIAAWTNSQILLKLISSKKNREGSSQSPYIKYIKVGAAVLAGAIVTTPQALLGYYFHNSVLAPTTIILANSGPNIHAFLSIKKRNISFFQSELNEKINTVRKRMIEAIKETRQLIESQPNFYKDFETRLSEILKENSSNQIMFNLNSKSACKTISLTQVQSLFSVLLNFKDEVRLYRSSINTAIKWIAGGGALFFASVDAVLNWHILQEGIKLISNNPVFYYPLTAVITGVAFKFAFPILSKALTSVAQATYHTSVSQFNRNASVPDKFYPKLLLILKLMMLTVSALSFGPPTEACLRYFKGNINVFMMIAESAMLSILVFRIFFDSIDDIMNFLIQLKGSGEDKKAIVILSKLNLFISSIEESSTIEVARVACLINNQDFNTLTEKLNLIREQIENFIKNSSESDDQNLFESLATPSYDNEQASFQLEYSQYNSFTTKEDIV